LRGFGLLDGVGDVAGDDAPEKGLLEGAVEDGMHQLNGAGTDAGLEAAVVEELDLVGAQAVQAEAAKLGEDVVFDDLAVLYGCLGADGRGGGVKPVVEVFGDGGAVIELLAGADALASFEEPVDALTLARAVLQVDASVEVDLGTPAAILALEEGAFSVGSAFGHVAGSPFGVSGLWWL
jgi:hypothetical protein